MQKYLLKTDSSVPILASPAWWISWAISAHLATFGLELTLLLHCNKAINKCCKVPLVSFLTSVSKSLWYFCWYLSFTALRIWGGLDAIISIKVSSLVPNPFIASRSWSASYSIGSAKRAIIASSNFPWSSLFKSDIRSLPKVAL